MGDNSDDFVSSRGAVRRRCGQSHIEENQRRIGTKARCPKRTLPSLKSLNAALAAPCAFCPAIARFACHSRLWGFLRWVLSAGGNDTFKST